jgi:hypothetical protein
MKHPEFYKKKESNEFLIIYVAELSTARKAGHVIMGRLAQILQSARHYRQN